MLSWPARVGPARKATDKLAANVTCFREFMSLSFSLSQLYPVSCTDIGLEIVWFRWKIVFGQNDTPTDPNPSAQIESVSSAIILGQHDTFITPIRCSLRPNGSLFQRLRASYPTQ